MTEVPDRLSAAEIGERLRIAREAARITQAAAAAAAGMARTTLVAIEQGTRQIRFEELRQFAQLYDRSVNALLRREAVQLDLLPKFRKLPGHSEAAVDAASRLLADLVGAEMELETLLGLHRTQNYPPRRPILPGEVRDQAEQDATEVRHWLGLGAGPAPDILDLLEQALGVRVFVRKLPPRLCGLFAFDPTAGACMLVNGAHPRGRMAQTAAHELGHLVATRDAPEVLLDAAAGHAREERYAAIFARGFLTPARGVMQRFQETVLGADRLTRRHVVLLAHAFGVSREAMVRRMEELKLVRAGTWDWFTAHGGISDIQVRQILGGAAEGALEAIPAADAGARRLELLAAEAWRRDLLSEAQLARMLRLDRVQLRAILDRTTLDRLDDADAETAPVLALHG